MYQRGYTDTLTACLMQPGTRRFELCPWPRRVFLGEYPRVQPHVSFADVHSETGKKAKPIPREYASVLCGTFEMLGNMPEEEGSFENGEALTVLLSDSCLYERFTPDSVSCDRDFEQKGFRLLTDYLSEVSGTAEACSRLLEETFANGGSSAHLNAFKESTMAPDLFGLTMPLIKGGLPLEFLFTSHLAVGETDLSGVPAAVLSYDFMKPESPYVNKKIAAWVKNGGQLIYVGAGDSPFADESAAWWKQLGYAMPEAHLFEQLGLARTLSEGDYSVGRGGVRRVCLSPARICLSAPAAESWRKTVAETLAKTGRSVQWRNHFTFRRGNYVVCAAMEESVSAEPVQLHGLYADMLSPTFAVRKDPIVACGERAILYELKSRENDFEIVGTQARVLSMKTTSTGCILTLASPAGILTHLRLHCPKRPERVNARTENGLPTEIFSQWETKANTVLLHYESTSEAVTVELSVAKQQK